MHSESNSTETQRWTGLIGCKSESERKLWAKRIERMRDSDLTVSEYANEIGVDERTMRRWEQALGGKQGLGQGIVLSVRRQPSAALPTRQCANARCCKEFRPERESQVYCCRRCRDAVRMARWRRSAGGSQEGT